MAEITNLSKKVKLLVEVDISGHLEGTTFINDENIFNADEGLLMLHSNKLGCNIGDVTVIEVILE